MISISFLLTALVIVLIPGTGVIYTINTGLTQKKRIMLAAAFGCTLGIMLKPDERYIYGLDEKEINGV